MSEKRFPLSTRTVKQIMADPTTPSWIKNGVKKLRRSNPTYAVFLEVIHDYRIRARAALAKAAGA
jgi:hypothetical protein